MSRNNKYTKPTEETQRLSEPVAAYITDSTVDEFVTSLPTDLMRQIIDRGVAECVAGYGTPHSQIEERLKSRMGWN